MLFYVVLHFIKVYYECGKGKGRNYIEVPSRSSARALIGDTVNGN